MPAFNHAGPQKKADFALTDRRKRFAMGAGS
jgi:hypothetical protein